LKPNQNGGNRDNRSSLLLLRRDDVRRQPLRFSNQVSYNRPNHLLLHLSIVVLT